MEGRNPRFEDSLTASQPCLCPDQVPAAAGAPDCEQTSIPQPPAAAQGLKDPVPFWPKRGLRSVPPPEWAQRLAEEAADQEDGYWDPLRLAASLRIRVEIKSLAAQKGGLEGYLRVGDPFVIVCDPAPGPEGTDALRLRVAHELAHTLFFDWRVSPPKETCGPFSSPDEEAFCNAFAASLLAHAPAAGSSQAALRNR